MKKHFTPSRSRSAGFTTLIAIFMLAMLGLAMLGVSAHFVQQAKRTASIRQQAQMRQWLLAAAIEAQHRLTQTPDHTTWSHHIAIPESINESQTTINLKSRLKDTLIQVDIDIRSPQRHVTQTLRFTPDAKPHAVDLPQWHFHATTNPAP